MCDFANLLILNERDKEKEISLKSGKHEDASNATQLE